MADVGLPEFREGAIYLSCSVVPVLDELWIIRDWIPRRGLSIIFGPSGAGKSHLGGNMAAHVGSGNPWHGHPVEPGFVAYVVLEGHGSIANRVAALAQACGDAPVWFMPARLSLAEAAKHAPELARVIAEEAANPGCRSAG